MTAKYGLPYFQNFINSEMSPGDVRSMCCRLQLDLRELLKRGNGLFGSAEQTGSLGVVTVNCARLGLPAPRATRPGCWRALDRLLDLARDVARAQARRSSQRYIDDGLFPYTRRYLAHARQPLLDDRRQRPQRDGPQLHGRRATTSPTRDGHALRRRGCSTTCARGWSSSRRRPATCTTWRPRRRRGRRTGSPRRTAARFPDDPAGRHRRPTRTTPTPRSCRSGFTDDPFEALERQDELQTKYTGGTVLHLYMAERLSTPDAVPRAGPARAVAVPAAVPDGDADVLDLPVARLPGRRAPRRARRAAASARCGPGSWATTGR